MAQTIENFAGRTLLEQFHELVGKINADLVPEVNDIISNLEKEIQDRTDADAQLSYDVADLQAQINAFGNVFTLKGSVASVSDLPASDNHVGDVWYVEDESTGYVWIDDNGTERWEQLGLTVDLSNYVTITDLATTLEDYQEKLTAGTNISIIGNTISATIPDTTASKVDSESASAGDVLTADGNGGASWQTPAGSSDAVKLDTSAQTFDDNKILYIKSAKTLSFNTKNSVQGFSISPKTANILSVKAQNDDQNYIDVCPPTASNDCYATIKKANVDYTLTIPAKTGTIALTSDVKSLYQHKIDIYKSNEFTIHFVIYNNSSTQLTSSDLSSICPIGVSGYVIVNSKYCTVTMIQWSYQLVASYIKDDLSGVDNAFCGTTFSMTDTVTQIL